MPLVKFSAQARSELLEAAREGNSRETCAGLAGITYETLRRWLKRGSEADEGSQYRTFAEEFAMAEAAARGRALRILNKAMVDSPRWAAWFLERRDPAFAPPASVVEKPKGPSVVILSLNDGAQLALPQAEVIEGEVVESDIPA